MVDRNTSKLGTLNPQPDSIPTHPKSAIAHKPISPMLLVTLHVTKIYEGPQEVLVHTDDRLNAHVAEAEAQGAAKRKIRYIEIVWV